MDFWEILDQSNHKPRKITADKLYSWSMKPGLQDNDVEMYSTFNERKSVFAKWLIKTLKKKICKYFFTNEYMTVVSIMCILMN